MHPFLYTCKHLCMYLGALETGLGGNDLFLKEIEAKNAEWKNN